MSILLPNEYISYDFKMLRSRKDRRL